MEAELEEKRSEGRTSYQNKIKELRNKREETQEKLE